MPGDTRLCVPRSAAGAAVTVADFSAHPFLLARLSLQFIMFTVAVEAKLSSAFLAGGE
jgi:hypothetical protein